MFTIPTPTPGRPRSFLFFLTTHHTPLLTDGFWRVQKKKKEGKSDQITLKKLHKR